MDIKILFKSGAMCTVKCQKFKLEKDDDDNIIGLIFNEILENKPLHISLNEVAAIFRENFNENS